MTKQEANIAMSRFAVFETVGVNPYNGQEQCRWSVSGSAGDKESDKWWAVFQAGRIIRAQEATARSKGPDPTNFDEQVRLRKKMGLSR
jgi:hypothetical protein